MWFVTGGKSYTLHVCLAAAPGIHRTWRTDVEAAGMKYMSDNPIGETTQVASSDLVGKRLMGGLVASDGKGANILRELFVGKHLPLTISIGLMIAVFVADLFLRAPIAIQLFYLVPILVSLWSTPQQHTLHLANASTALTVLGAFYSRHGSAQGPDFANRILALVIIWIAAVICILRKQTVEKLRDSFAELEIRVQQRTAELTKVNESLQAEIADRKTAESALRQLSGRLLTLQDEERRRIARELHDTTAQSLAAIAVNLARVEKLAPNLDPKASDVLADSLALAEQCSREIRTLSYLLHPPLLEEAGLAAALGWYANGFTQRSNVKVALDVAADLGHLPNAVEMTLFRIVQESLTNIARHSGSPTATISLVRAANEVVLHVQDQGRGIPQERLGKVSGNISGLGVGIAGIWERVRQYNGRMDIDSSSRGTKVRVSIPIPEEEDTA
jgi:signal transduction histidine kinase